MLKFVSVARSNFVATAVAVLTLGLASSSAGAINRDGITKAVKRPTFQRPDQKTNQKTNQKTDQKTSAKQAKRKPAVTKAKPAQQPSGYIANKAQKLLSALKSRPMVAPVTGNQEAQEVKISAQKTAWLEGIYNRNMIEASWATEMLSDKRILSEVLSRELGDRATQYYPKTLGLREFLSKHRLVNSKGKVTPDGDAIEMALHEEFPSGFMVRPAVGIAPQEKGKGLFPDTDTFILTLITPDNSLYSPAHMLQPVRSHILDAIASGEAIVLQENFIAAADAHKPLKNRIFNEVRIHTYEGRVVEGAIPDRWVQTNLLDEKATQRAEAFVGEFLKLLSPGLLNRQAWGVDVAVMDNGEMRLIDIVTNRGKKIAWSGYLDQPRVIAAYSRHFELHNGMRFKGFAGTLIRNGFANYFPYWEKRIEKARPGWSKAMAYLPPMP